tara:strand:- start:371 stop:1108 length:738 start_codon:yes stop_codon:yes gene_type:complete
MENKKSKPALPAGRYLKYAIGEIILVVIGILIALGINNWNEKRTTSNQSNIYLKNLNKELNKNIEVLKWESKKFESIAEIAHHYHSKLMDKSSKIEDTIISNFVLKINPIPSLNLSRTVLRDYLNSGFLKDIQNDTLKNKILFLESRYNFYISEIENVNSKYTSDIEPYLLQYADYTEFVDSVGDYKIKKTEFGHQKDAFINNKLLSNKLIWYIGYIKSLQEVTNKRTQSYLETLSSRINTYLND